MSVARIVPGPALGRAAAPPSKSYTHRFLVAAHLSGRPCRVDGPLLSDDTLRTARALGALSSRVRRERRGWTVAPSATGRRSRRRRIDCGESGTTLRLLTALASLDGAPTSFVGRGRLDRRPIVPLTDALAQLGASVALPGNGRSLPLRLRGPIHGGATRLRVDESSQFTSALLFALPTVRPDSTIATVGAPVSEPYVRASLAVLRRSGVRVAADRAGYRVPGGQRYRPPIVPVPGDASSAAYLWAAAAVSGGDVTVDGIDPSWPQADLAVLDLLERYGSEVARRGRRIAVRGARRRPFRVTLTQAPDLYPLAGVLAALAPGSSQLRGAAQVAAKESDRKAETARLARALGAKVDARPGGLVIHGTDRPRALRAGGFSDHRLVMSAAVAALAGPGASEIADASAVGKSFPGFFEALAGLGAEVRLR